MTGTAQAQRGFTLVELLVVMALLGLISALLFGGLRYTARAAAHGTAVLDRASDLVLAANFLRSSLADARPLPDPSDVPQDKAVAFVGTSDAIAMIGVLPPHLGQSGFYRISLALDRDKHDLVAAWSPVSPDAAAPPASTLLGNVARVDMGYFGAVADEKAPSWHDLWKDQATLPSLVRLRIGFTDGTRAPDLVVAVHTAGVTP